MRLTAGKVLLDQSMLASETGSPSKKGDPVSWSCRFVAGSGRAGHCDTGPAFVPPIASLIAAATADRSVLAIGHDFEVIPVMAFLRGRSHGRARGRRVVVLCRSHRSQRGKGVVGLKPAQATKASFCEM